MITCARHFAVRSPARCHPRSAEPGGPHSLDAFVRAKDSALQGSNRRHRGNKAECSELGRSGSAQADKRRNDA